MDLNKARQQMPPLGVDDVWPTGVPTFLMTDVEGSTRTWESSRELARAAILRHNKIAAEQVLANRGRIVEAGREGDGLLAVFSHASAAAACALGLQRAFSAEEWPGGAQLRVRIGLHSGEAELHEGHYVGVALYRCARIMATAHGGQIVVSQATADLLADEPPDGATLRDLGSHRLKDLSRPERVYQLIHADLAATFPPLRSLGSSTNNLPIPLTSFVGREDELGELRSLLDGVRLLTLIGTAGSGKTRLALELASRARHDFPDGVYIVEFAGVTDGSLVSDAVAAALDIRGSGSPLDLLGLELRPKQMLLVLDNCEHLTDSISGLVAFLLTAAPMLRVLATGRQPLGTAGEQTWKVAPLSVREASLLFVDRAHLRSGLRLGDDNRAPIEDLCQRLDGLPLAIELAAARTQVLAPHQILERLNDALGLLAHDSSTTSPRQQTLQSAIDWSYRLLGPAEQGLFDQLSTFSGGFDLEAAEAVAETHVLDSLAALIDKSLVIAEPNSAGAMRYRMLEVLRQYGQAQLTLKGELAAVQKRHATFFMELARRFDGARRSRDADQWLPRLRYELDNLRASLEWARAQPTDDGIRLISALARFWELMGSVREARSWMDAMLALGTADLRLLSTALLRSSRLAYLQGDYDLAWSEGQRSLEMKRELKDGLGIARRLSFLATVAIARDDVIAATEIANECLALRLSHGDALAVAWSQTVLGFAVLQGDHVPEAETLFSESLAIHRSNSDYAGMAYALGGLAVVKLEGGDLVGARLRLREVLSMVADWSWVDDPAWLTVSMLLAAAEGRYRSAVRLEGGLARLEREGRRFNQGIVRRYQALIDAARHKLKAAEVSALVAEGSLMTRSQLLSEAMVEPARSTRLPGVSDGR